MRWTLAVLMAVSFAAGCARTPVAKTADAAADDQRLVSVIARRFFADQRLCGFQIDIVARRRAVLLTGRVATPAQRQRAEAMAIEAGATQVVNRLTLQPSAEDRERC
jgi:osmotically-inducible protein OsmY